MIHGTLHCYNKGGCRCPACRQARREYRAEYDRRNGIVTRERPNAYTDEDAISDLLEVMAIGHQ